MFKLAKPLFLICETPLHVGSGEELGIVDLPIQRERHTSFPKVESSSLKGSLRSAFEQQATDPQALIKIHTAFGYDEASVSAEVENAFKDNNGNKTTEFIGCLGFTDARLLLFPVKSMRGIFAWITCPRVLKKFATDMALCDKIDSPRDIIPVENTTTKTSQLGINDKSNEEECVVVLEEYTFPLTKDDQCSEFAEWLEKSLFASTSSDEYWKSKISKDIVVLPDNEFKDFVNLSTEVITRIKINNETGTVQEGALFTEEFLPAESIMYSLVLATPEFGNKSEKSFQDEQEVIDFFDDNIGKIKLFQLGAGATLGRGFVRTIFLNKGVTKGVTNGQAVSQK